MSNESSIKIGELLVRAGVVTGVDLSEAEKLAKHMQVQFGRILIMSGCLTEHDLECALEAQVLIKAGKLGLEIACDALAIASREQIPFTQALQQTHVPEPTGDQTLAMAELLADSEIVSPDELEAALDASLESKTPLAEVLLAGNVISPLVEAIVEEMLVQLKKGERTRDAAIAEIRKTYAVWTRANESLKSDEDALPSVAASMAEIASAQGQAAPAAPRDPRQDYAEDPMQSAPFSLEIPGGYGSTSSSSQVLPPAPEPAPTQAPAPEPANPNLNLPAAPKFQGGVLGYQLRPEDAPQAPVRPPESPRDSDDHLSIHQVLSSYSSEILDDTGSANKPRQTPEPVEWLQTLLATAQSAPPQPAGARQAQSADTWNLVPPPGQDNDGPDGWKKFDGQVPWNGAAAEAAAAPPPIPPAQPASTSWQAELERSTHASPPHASGQPPHVRVHSRHLSEQHLPLIGTPEYEQAELEHNREIERLEQEKQEWQRLEAMQHEQELRELERLAALAEAERERERLEAEQAEYERQRLAAIAAAEQAVWERQMAEQAAFEQAALRQAALEQAERERQLLAEQAALEQAERERQRVAEQEALEQAEREQQRLAAQEARAQERLIAEAAERAEQERLQAEEAERAREQERLIAIAAEQTEIERTPGQAADDTGSSAATNKINALARLRPTNPQIIAQSRQSGASIPAVSDAPPPPPPAPVPQVPVAAPVPPSAPKVQAGKTLELETPNVKRAPVSRTAPIIELLQTAGAFTTGELGTAVARALADQDRAGELVRLLGLVTKELVDAAGKCCKAIADEQLTYEQARQSILCVKAGKPLKEALQEAGMQPEALAAAIPDMMAGSEAPDDSDSPAIDDALHLGSSQPSPGPLTLDDLDEESGKSRDLAPQKEAAVQSYEPPEPQMFSPGEPHAAPLAVSDERSYSAGDPHPRHEEKQVSMIVPVIDETPHALPEVDPVTTVMNEWESEEEPIVFEPDATADKPTNPFNHLNKAPAAKTHVIVASESGTSLETLDETLTEPASAGESREQLDYDPQHSDARIDVESSAGNAETTPQAQLETQRFDLPAKGKEEFAPPEEQQQFGAPEEQQHFALAGNEQLFAPPAGQDDGDGDPDTAHLTELAEQPVAEHNGVEPESPVAEDNGVQPESPVAEDNGVEPESPVAEDSGVEPETVGAEEAPQEAAPARARKSRSKTEKAEKSEKATEKAAPTKAKKPTKRKR